MKTRHGKTARTRTARLMGSALLAATSLVASAATALAGTPGDLGDGDGNGKADLWATTATGHYSSVDSNDRTEFWATTNGTGYGTKLSSVHEGLGTASATIAAPDLNGDHRADLFVRFGDHLYAYYTGANGTVRRAFEVGHGWGAMSTLLYAGRLTGDSSLYLLGRSSVDGNLYAYHLQPGGSVVGIGKVGQGWGGMQYILGVGQMVGDAKADLVGINAAGVMYCYAGTGLGRVSSVGECGHGWSGFRTVFVIGDRDGDGRWDIVGVRYPTVHNAKGDIILPAGKSLSQLSPTDRGPMYLYQNLGNAVWGPARLIGHDMFMYDLFA